MEAKIWRIAECTYNVPHMHSFQDMYDWLSAFVAVWPWKLIFVKTPKNYPKLRTTLGKEKKAFQKYSEGSWEFQIHDDENRKDAYSGIIKDANIDKQFKMYWKICFKPLGITMKGSKRNTPKSGFIFCISWEILVKDEKELKMYFHFMEIL